MKKTIIFLMIMCSMCFPQNHFLKSFNLESSIEFGMIPGHNLSLYKIPEYNLNINISQTYYADLQERLDITKYAFISGGLTSYFLTWKTFQADFYPLRMDFNFGVGFKYKYLEIGYKHGCFHPIAPNIYAIPLPKIDASQDNFYIKATINNKLFN
jgi:hypothetical protein